MTTHYSTCFLGTRPGMENSKNNKPTKHGALEAFYFQERVQERKNKNQGNSRVIASWTFFLPSNVTGKNDCLISLEALLCKGINIFVTFLLPETSSWKKPSVSAVSGFLKNPYIIYMYWYVFIIHTNIREKNLCCRSDRFIDWRVA